ncbi:MAG: Fic family protein [Alphaproteobacteria bacterium]|nr:Fic family protein [Alphaproteobacteria bacterium]
MAKKITERDLVSIEEVVAAHPEGVSAEEVLQGLPAPGIPLRTLQFRLQRLVAGNRLVKQREGRKTRYRLAPATSKSKDAEAISSPEDGPRIALSAASIAIRDYVRREPAARTPVGYNRRFLDDYRPNTSFYLSGDERSHLWSIGQPGIAQQPAGTYAKRILSRLLIELTWNSSRLEGNTYSLLDTKRLIEFGMAAHGRQTVETQMILNHKSAIEFLVDAAPDIGFTRSTILNLHAMLADNLLDDTSAPGRLRYIPVLIGGSVFHPLEVPQLIEEYFDQILATATAIKDPFEQAFFVMVQLPYLQPFEDVNKRVSRLAANIPLITKNLCPLSFADVPRETYTEALLGVYELNQIDLLKQVFMFAYERSAPRYHAVRQSIGAPDPFRLRYTVELHEIVADLVRSGVTRNEAPGRIEAWSEEKISPEDRAHFNEVVETELLSLHDGNFHRYRLRPSEFANWRKLWGAA